MWKSEERKEEMTAPITLRPLDEQGLIDLRRRSDETSDAETRTRYQMLLLEASGQTSTQIAQTVLRSQDTVVRVLKWFITVGVEAIPRRTAPGRERTVTEAWEAELLRVIELDPARQSGRIPPTGPPSGSPSIWASTRAWRLTEETVRVYLHALNYVCKRPTWTLRRKAEVQTHYA
jgi:transposase